MNEFALQVKTLSKSYLTPAVDSLSLSIPAGEFYALLGPNGAGKTTTLRMVCGLLKPDWGEIRVFGRDMIDDAREAKRLIAYVPDEPPVYDKLSGWEYLEFVAGLWGIEAAEAEPEAKRLLELLALADAAGQRVETYSRGMKQKLALAGALIHKPRLLVLDEPLTGVDALAAHQIKEMLTRHALEGGSVILSTHILEVAERLADRIGVIAHGRLVAEGPLDQLREQVGRKDGSLEDVFLELTRDEVAA
jgi:ABC-2 type transport system ATP-binding protein